MVRTLAIILVSLLATSLVHAEEVDYNPNKPERGWFWYEEPPVEQPKKPEKKEKPKTAAAASSTEKKEKKPMTAEWLKEMIPKMRMRALDDPSRENMAAYFFLQRVEMDKAQRFAKAGKEYVSSEPILDENNRVPVSGYGKNEFMDRQFKAKKNVLNYLAKDVGGIFMFFDSKCDFCKAQLKIVNYLKDAYGFEVKFISMDGKGLSGIDHWEPDNGHAKMLNLKIFPTTVLAVPPNTYLIVSQGVMAQDQLEERILTAATSNKLLPDDMDTSINPFDRGVLTTKDMADGASDDPAEFVKYIKEKLEKRY